LEIPSSIAILAPSNLEFIMSRICEVTGKTGLVGHMVSHSQRKKLIRQQPNLQTKRFYVPEEDRWVKLKVSAAGLRTINKRGIFAVVKELGI
jgi:large subunit ribosomal protein L28